MSQYQLFVSLLWRTPICVSRHTRHTHHTHTLINKGFVFPRPHKQFLQEDRHNIVAMRKAFVHLIAAQAKGCSEVLEDLQVLLRHRRVFLPVVLWVHIKVGCVALVGNFRNNRRLGGKCTILRGLVHTTRRRKKIISHHFRSQ